MPDIAERLTGMSTWELHEADYVAPTTRSRALCLPYDFTRSHRPEAYRFPDELNEARREIKTNIDRLLREYKLYLFFEKIKSYFSGFYKQKA